MRSGIRYTDAPADIAEEIRASVFIADDFPGPDELRRELKKSVTLRLDPDVYTWFRLPGSGYQTRINAVLRAYMESVRNSKARQANLEGSYLSKAPGKKAAKAAAKKAASARKMRKAAKSRRVT
jgi:uncharacterized protein (DUF4415 family)